MVIRTVLVLRELVGGDSNSSGVEELFEDL